jgi:hypothetical protein
MDYSNVIEEQLRQKTGLEFDEIGTFVDLLIGGQMTSIKAYALWRLSQADPEILTSEIVDYLAWEGA